MRRDGNSEPYHSEDQGDSVRIYFGSSTYDLPLGTHSYQFTYRANRELGFFGDHDHYGGNVLTGG